MNTVKTNIYNLTSLWEIAGNSLHAFHNRGGINYCYISGSQWPNRVWSTQELEENLLLQIKEIIKNNNELGFSRFEMMKDSELKSFTKAGFAIKSTQYGMSLPLQKPFVTSSEMKFHRVENERDSRIWGEAFAQSFGYIISDEIILKTQREIPYLLVYNDDKLIGTIILFHTKETAGIHSLGVIPKMRGRGFATEIMYHVLNKALTLGATLAVLQASEMAKPLYKKLGFSLDFFMKNYQLQQ